MVEGQVEQVKGHALQCNEKRLDHSRVEPTPLFARALGRNRHRQMVSRLGLEPRALALKGRCSTD